jgi:hypothetical protein
MVGLYDDPFAYDGSEFNTFLAQEQFASGSSPEDFHVTSATEPTFPSTIHALKAAQQPHHRQPYLSPTDPLGPNIDNALRTPAHLPRSVPPTSYPSNPNPQRNSNNLTIDTMGLTWNTTAPTTNPTSAPQQQQPPQQPQSIPIPDTADQVQLHTLLSALQAELRQTALERDEARMQLSTARNELYAARQIEKRLRVERDEARSQADFLGSERAKLKQSETRLRRERNEARVLVMKGRGSGGKRGVGAGGQGGLGALVGGAESQGEDSGESPPMGMDQT